MPFGQSDERRVEVTQLLVRVACLTELVDAGVGEGLDAFAHRRIGVIAQPVRRLHDVRVGVVHDEAGRVVRHHTIVASGTGADIARDVCTAALRPTTTAPRTTAIVAIAATDKSSPSSGQPHTIASAGWASCIWLALAIPALAMPAYQAKNPRNIENNAV